MKSEYTVLKVAFGKGFDCLLKIKYLNPISNQEQIENEKFENENKHKYTKVKLLSPN